MLYIHIHLPILGVEKKFEQWLKLTIANIVTELSANNTICWFTKEITTKMKTNTFSIATFVARLSKSWKIWKITGKSWESHEIKFTEIFKIFFCSLQIESCTQPMYSKTTKWISCWMCYLLKTYCMIRSVANFYLFDYQNSIFFEISKITIVEIEKKKSFFEQKSFLYFFCFFVK